MRGRRKKHKLLNEVNEVNDRGKLHTREWKQCAVEASLSRAALFILSASVAPL